MNTTVVSFAERVADATPTKVFLGHTDDSSESAPHEVRSVSGKTVSLAEHFTVLARWWHQDTDELSSPSAKAEHPAYGLIVQMGREAIPLILADLREHGGDWYRALRALGAEVGDLPQPGPTTAATKAAWFQWGAAHGFV